MNDYEKIEKELTALKSREEGITLLKKHNLLKPDLLILAKKLDPSAKNADNKAKLEEKIIEATIGYRLRSQAITGI